MVNPIIALIIILVLHGTSSKTEEFLGKISGAGRSQQLQSNLTGLIASPKTHLAQLQWETMLNINKDMTPADRRDTVAWQELRAMANNNHDGGLQLLAVVNWHDLYRRALICRATDDE